LRLVQSFGLVEADDALGERVAVDVPVVAADRRHTRARAPAIAAHNPPSVAGSIWRNVRYRVESDDTDPNSSPCARRCSMSAYASPPPASINIA